MTNPEMAEAPSIPWRIGFVAMCLAIFAAVTILRDSDTAVVAAFSFAATAVAARMRWDLRQLTWFRMLIAVFAIVHIGAVLLVGWRIHVHPTILLAPIAIADFLAMLWLIFVVEKLVTS